MTNNRRNRRDTVRDKHKNSGFSRADRMSEAQSQHRAGTPDSPDYPVSRPKGGAKKVSPKRKGNFNRPLATDDSYTL